ncbi:TetR family transcriptional regulator [Rhodococcus sp. NPDC058521]|uniref:TetR family transcriptional regulator n=1 Tax=Rhodococcus sp. NPDC058521 TaxID=3346536 RepID=UPI003653898B
MPRPLDHAKREELLVGVVKYIDEFGLADVSLRPLAAALGTSSRMLVHYFGTKEELLVQALYTQHPRFGAVFDGVRGKGEFDDALRGLWVSMSQGPDVLSTRILLQAMGVAAGRPGPFAAFVEDAIDSLLQSLARALQRCGMDDADARIEATVASAAFRGLLLDRMVTGDSLRTDRAAEVMIGRMVSAVPR